MSKYPLGAYLFSFSILVMPGTPAFGAPFEDAPFLDYHRDLSGVFDEAPPIKPIGMYGETLIGLKDELILKGKSHVCETTSGSKIISPDPIPPSGCQRVYTAIIESRKRTSTWERSQGDAAIEGGGDSGGTIGMLLGLFLGILGFGVPLGFLGLAPIGVMLVLVSMLLGWVIGMTVGRSVARHYTEENFYHVEKKEEPAAVNSDTYNDSPAL